MKISGKIIILYALMIVPQSVLGHGSEKTLKKQTLSFLLTQQIAAYTEQHPNYTIQHKPLTRIAQDVGCDQSLVSYIENISPEISFTFADLNAMHQLPVVKKEILNIAGCHLGSLKGLNTIPGIAAVKKIIANNNLLELRANDFEGVPNVTDLSLASNGLDFIPDAIFANLPKLYTLDLSHNRLQQFSRESFAGAPKLARLLLNANKLTSLHAATFQVLPELQYLMLSNNSRLPREFNRTFDSRAAVQAFIVQLQANEVVNQL